MVCFTKWPRINILDKVAGVGASYRFNHRKHYKLKPSQSLWRLSSKLKAPRAHCGPCGAVQDKDGGTPPHVQLPKKGGNLEAQLQPHLGEGGQVNNWSLMSSPLMGFSPLLPFVAIISCITSFVITRSVTLKLMGLTKLVTNWTMKAIQHVLIRCCPYHPIKCIKKFTSRSKTGKLNRW